MGFTSGGESRLAKRKRKKGSFGSLKKAGGLEKVLRQGKLEKSGVSKRAQRMQMGSLRAKEEFK